MTVKGSLLVVFLFFPTVALYRLFDTMREGHTLFLGLLQCGVSNPGLPRGDAPCASHVKKNKKKFETYMTIKGSLLVVFLFCGTCAVGCQNFV